MLPVPTRLNKQRQGLNIYGRFIQMVGNPRIRRVCTVTDCLKFHFIWTLFTKRRKVWVRGLEFREKVNQIKSSSILSSVPWALVFICVLGKWTPHPGAQWLTYHLDDCHSPGHKGGTAYGLLESGWVIPSVPEAIAFYIH